MEQNNPPTAIIGGQTYSGTYYFKFEERDNIVPLKLADLPNGFRFYSNLYGGHIEDLVVVDGNHARVGFLDWAKASFHPDWPRIVRDVTRFCEALEDLPEKIDVVELHIEPHHKVIIRYWAILEGDTVGSILEKADALDHELEGLW